MENKQKIIPFLASSMKIGFYIIIILLFSLTSFAQEKTDKLPTYFGLQLRPIFPTQFIGNPTTSMSGDGFETSITQRLGFGFGGTVRASVTKLIAIETGINFTQRYFNLSVALADSNVYGEQSMTFIEYDIPINALIYIQLSDKIFMNASLGVAISYKPTDTRVQIRPQGKHYFALYGIRDNSVGLDLNANFGFEYRTRKNGFFYIGGSARVPFAPLFKYAAFYNYDANSILLTGDVDGSFLTLDFKYFFPLIKNKGQQFLNGPIE
ncbi:MAG: hypothetical protein HRT58_14830 [Crocinitomicaceae bacterium]|nr:hypothetical protein [Crocinitomicaceae bacterium]